MKKHTHTPEGFKEEDYSDEDIALQVKDKENADKLIAELEAWENLKTSARAKLVAGQPLTEEEAKTFII
tara:strand:- start:4 stop:210 length:207 start_codon:yes stop_codon:yes gene_type:complete